ncbi:MAG: EAL domain-containing protein [Pseudomonadota bacterium]
MLLAIEGEIDSLFDRVPFGSHTESADGTFLSINALVLAWLGHTREELIGKRKLSDFLTPQSQEIYRRYRSENGPPLSMADLPLEPLEIFRRDGSSMPISLSAMLGAHSASHLLNTRFMIIDMTESRLQMNGQNISAAIFESPSGTFVTDKQGTILQVNDAFTTITGFSAIEAIGQTPRMLSSGRHNLSFYEALWNSIKATGRWQGEMWNRRKNGEIYVEWLSISAVLDVSGSVTNYVGSFTDITSSKNALDLLSHMAYHDALTQLPNRRLFLDRLGQAISASRRSQFFNAIFFVDLDNFKAINDAFGHETGDLVLMEVAQRLRNAVREGDSVARLSGDEFAILLVDLDSQHLEAAAKARNLGEKILAALSQTYPVGQQDFHCSASIGLELFQDANTASELLQHADLAMYQSKKSGKNTLRFFDQTMQAALAARFSLEVELHEALDKQQFRLFFQPQVNQHRETLGAEVLLRWEHPRHGLVSPLEFIPLAEETRLILPIGAWVLETACAQLKVWEGHPVAHSIQLAVNVSPLQFHQHDFVAHVTALVAASGINPKRLKLEITESMVLDMEDTVTKMQALQKIGVNFAMDDFGTGFSSLSVLTRLPIQQLKIDQSFVRNIGLRDADGVIVQTIIAMAHTLDFEVIAEGVETEAQRAFLDKNGCKHFQGYLFSRPVPIDEFEELLTVRSERT